jgi:hypothetical protein
MNNNVTVIRQYAANSLLPRHCHHAQYAMSVTPLNIVYLFDEPATGIAPCLRQAEIISAHKLLISQYQRYTAQL